VQRRRRDARQRSGHVLLELRRQVDLGHEDQHLLALRDDDPAYPALTLGNYLLGGNFDCRLINRLRQKEGLCYGTGSHLSVDPQDRYALFMIHAICNPENIDKVDRGALEEVDKILKKGIDAAELELGKKGYLEEARVERSQDVTLAATLNELTHLGRTFAYVGDQENRIGRLTATEVNRAMTAALQPAKLVIVRAGDFNRKTKAGTEKEKK